MTGIRVQGRAGASSISSSPSNLPTSFVAGFPADTHAGSPSVHEASARSRTIPGNPSCLSEPLMPAVTSLVYTGALVLAPHALNILPP